jgi:hypothetical protein
MNNALARELGDSAEHFATALLQSRGYQAASLRKNYPTYDLQVDADCTFYVSVKALRTKQHVRLGSLASVNRLSEGNFVFAFLPAIGAREIQLSQGCYHNKPTACTIRVAARLAPAT